MKRFGKRRLRFTLVAIALLVLAIPLVSRIKGVVIGRYVGKVTGYAKDAGVWLFNEFAPSGGLGQGHVAVPCLQSSTRRAFPMPRSGPVHA